MNLGKHTAKTPKSQYFHICINYLGYFSVFLFFFDLLCWSSSALFPSKFTTVIVHIEQNAISHDQMSPKGLINQL